jgi:hypothetical protein
MSQKFTVPTEMIDLPSKGLLYPKDNPLSSGQVEMKYMTAREEDILTNPNLLRQGLAIEKTLKSLIKSPINYEDLTVGDRNALLIAARILAYGKEYSFHYDNPNTGEEEKVTVDLQDLKYKPIDESKYSSKNEISFELPYSKNTVTFKILTVTDDKKIDEEYKGLKKALGNEAVGLLSTRLKHQITSINGDYSTKAVREFIDDGYLLARDSTALRAEMSKHTPDIDTKISFTLKDGSEITTDLPMGAEFFFPGSGL